MEEEVEKEICNEALDFVRVKEYVRTIPSAASNIADHLFKSSISVFNKYQQGGKESNHKIGSATIRNN